MTAPGDCGVNLPHDTPDAAPDAAVGAPVEAPDALAFERVSKWYGDIAALLDVSFRVGCEVVGLVGKNGVGKSTLMKLAAGLLRPSQGRVLVAGTAAGSRVARAKLGFCPEVERLYDELSGVRFVAWMLRLHGFSGRAAAARASDVLAELGLGDAMNRPIRTYSKGMRQRVRLAQALAHRPRFLLLDEPMTGLDPLARADLSRIIRVLPQQGVGVLVSSHVLHELEAVVDRVVLVHQGRLLAEGRVHELRAQLPAQPHRVRLGCKEPRVLAAAVVGWPDVQSVQLRDDAVEVAILGGDAFYRAVTALGATFPGGIDEVVPLDDDLASLFGYLVG
jgi:ABC-2 type transport system ATP-binding protein